MNNIHQKTISLSEQSIHFLSTDRGQKNNLLLLHGKKFTASTWHELKTLEALASAECHAIAIDMPGYGKSPSSDLKPSQVLSEFIPQSGLVKPILIGPSMGGRTCLEFCLNFPEQVGGLILLGAVGVQENIERLSEIKIPTLIIWGSEDTISSPENGEILHKNIPHSKLVIFDDAPHPCYLKYTDRWHQELLVFIDSIG